MSDKIAEKQAEIDALDAEILVKEAARSRAKKELRLLEAASRGLVPGKTMVREKHTREREGIFVRMDQYGWIKARPLKKNGRPQVREVTFFEWEIVDD